MENVLAHYYQLNFSSGKFASLHWIGLNLNPTQKKLKLSYKQIEKLSRIPSIESIVQELKARGFKASRTLFNNTGVKTNADEEAVKEVIKKLSNA